jgi:uncharacterized protein (TIGR03067 family)
VAHDSDRARCGSIGIVHHKKPGTAMFTKSILVTTILCLAVAQSSNDDKAKKDLERMQGAWVLHALEINGKDVPAPKLDGTILIIKKDEYYTKVKDKEQLGFRLKLDPSKNPKAVDMIKTMPGGTEEVIKGIYTFENDTLKFCRGLAASQERPGQFATWPDTNYFVVTWKKQSK